jgi:hypothetical protein
VFLTLGLAFNSLAQVAVSPPITTSIPVVTIQATDPTATWSGTPGVFTVFRAGNAAPALNVYYEIGGTAVNGVDYQTIGNWVQIPSGVLSGDIVIHPINRGESTDKTVTLTLTNSPALSPAGSAIPVNYIIGNPSSATVDITPGPLTNIPPEVSLVFPADGATFYTPINLPIVACASDVDGSVVSVEFFENGVSLGTVSNSPSPVILPAIPGSFPPMPPIPPYRPFVLVWTNVPPGTNVLLTAKATDNGGASTTSEPVSITVHPGPPPPPPPPTNLPPVVRITSPADGATFRAPVNLPIYAYAADPDGYVTGVEFFAGTNDLGPGHQVTAVPPPLPPGPIQPPILIVVPTNYWELVWSNAPQGTFALTAVATDNGGASTVSEAVNVTILPPSPPPTPTNVVNIVALDPIAIRGTNCWPWLGLAGATPAWTNWTASTAVCRYFTNCGPKDAVFAVHRFGETNDDLAVTYNVGGTASNGVDYVKLPGTVTILAGQRAALITVVPLDDGSPDLISTVILTLTPGGYIIGRPPSAAAIILEAPVPPPVAAVLPDKCFHVGATGPDGAWFHIESTTDLLHWTPICTNQVVHGSIDFIDPAAQNNQVQFYRAVPEANPPAD